MKHGLRRMAFAGALVLALILLVYRLTEVQVVEGASFAAAARANTIQRIPIAAPRGLVIDRRGSIIVRSRPSFVCALIPSESEHIDATLHGLSAILHIPADTLRDRALHHHGINYRDFDELTTFEPYGPVILASDLTPAQMARVAEAQGDFPGIDIEEQPVRNYPFGADGSHIFGYVGAITAEEYSARKRDGYSPNDVVGKDGIEKVYDRYLRGTTGGEQVEVNAQGRLVRKLAFIDPIPGNELVLSLDWRLQQIIERALGDQIKKWSASTHRHLTGAVVAINPTDGGILALASYPNFNPNDFAIGIKARTYAHYVLDGTRPLFDRAIGAATPTGSTFKMVTGSGAISARVISPDQILYDSGSWDCHGATFSDIASGGLGTTDFVRALAASSDGYFYQLADRLGHDRLRYYAEQYGLNAVSGIDLPNEYEGNWPTNAWSMKVYKLPLEPSDVCQLGIGQGAMQATPLQMANVTATVVNGGTLFHPHVVEEIRTPRGKLVKRFDHDIIRRVPVTEVALRQVRRGMDRVTEPYGTAYGLAIPGLPFGGKTGTVETDGGHGPNTTWFVAYAPTDHPKIAMAVFMERTGSYGASVAAPVAQRVLAEYFHKKIPQ